MSTDATPAPETEPTEKRGLRKWLGDLSTGVKTIGGSSRRDRRGAGSRVPAAPQPPSAAHPGGRLRDLREADARAARDLRAVPAPGRAPADGVHRDKLRQPGVIAAVQLTIKGYRGKSLPLRWYALDLGTHDIVDEQSKRYLFKPDRNVTPLTWPFWVAIPDTPGPFKIVFEIYPPGAKPGKPGVVPFAKAETDPFER